MTVRLINVQEKGKEREDVKEKVVKASEDEVEMVMEKKVKASEDVAKAKMASQDLQCRMMEKESVEEAVAVMACEAALTFFFLPLPPTLVGALQQKNNV